VRGSVVNPDLVGEIRQKELARRKINQQRNLLERNIKTSKRKRNTGDKVLQNRITDKINDSEAELGMLSNKVDDLSVEIHSYNAELTKSKKEDKQIASQLRTTKKAIKRQVKSELKEP